VGRFRLCTLDLDGTLLATTCFATVGEAFGKGAEIRRLDDLYFAGKQSLAENFQAELALLEGIPVPEAKAALRKGPWMRHIPEGVRALRALGLQVGLLTDQPRFLAEEAEPTLDPLLCSEGGTKEGRIHAASVAYREDKAAHLKGWCKERGIALDEVVHVGNGSNDVPVFERVGLAVAVNAPPEVARRADVAMEQADSLEAIARVLGQALGQGG
jgi:phosphoserine phosphatase